MVKIKIIDSYVVIDGEDWQISCQIQNGQSALATLSRSRSEQLERAERAMRMYHRLTEAVEVQLENMCKIGSD